MERADGVRDSSAAGIPELFHGRQRRKQKAIAALVFRHEKARELTKTAHALFGRYRLLWLFVSFLWHPNSGGQRSKPSPGILATKRRANSQEQAPVDGLDYRDFL